MRAELAAGAFLFLASAAAGAPVYEEPPTLSAELILPRQLRAGPHHRVAEVVTSDGYLNTYTIESDFGVFTVSGDDLLRVRVEEIAALAALEEVTRSEAFARAAAAAAKRPFEAAAKVVTQPGGTLKRLPSGVNRYFRRTARKVAKTVREADEYLDERRSESEAEEAEAGEAEPGAETAAGEGGGGEPGEGEEAPDEESDLEKAREVAAKATRRYLGVGRSMRDWARRLGVDPYTTNETLRRELERVAAVASVGSFAVRLATPGLGAIGTLGEVNDLVWSMGAADLEVLNAGRLRDMGLDRAEVRAFFDNPAWTPTRLTALAAALDDLRVVYGRGALARLAAAAGSEEEAFFFQRSAELLRVVHREVSPLRRIHAGGLWGGGVTAGGVFVMPLALDYLAWTEDAAATFADDAGRFLGRPGVGRLELWIAGRASPRARGELEKLGFAVEERARERWLER